MLAACCASAQEDLYRDAIESIAEGRPEEANEVLTRMIEQAPQHAGAWLDLAIIQCELGNPVEAERLFRLIEERFAPPPGIQEVIASYRERGCTGRQLRSQTMVMLSRGKDSNVNQGASNPNFSIGSGSARVDLELLPEFLPQKDQFTQLAAEYVRDLNRHGTLGFVQLRMRENDSLTRYNTASFRFGVEHPWNIGAWGVRAMGSLAALTLGNHLYQRQGQVQARVTPPLKLPENIQLNLLTGLTRLEYPTVSNFNSTNLEAGALLMVQGKRSQVQANLGYLFDQGDGGRLGGNREGWFASLQGQVAIREGLIGELGWSRQNWMSDSAYSPGLIDQIRNQDTQLFRAALVIPVKEHHSLHIEWRKVKNDENISIFQYNSRLLQVSWQWRNF